MFNTKSVKFFLFVILSFFSFTIFAADATTIPASEPPAQTIAVAKLDTATETANKVDALEKNLATMNSQLDVIKQTILALNTQVVAQTAELNQLQQQLLINKRQSEFNIDLYEKYIGNYAQYLHYFSGPIPNLLIFLVFILFIICWMFGCLNRKVLVENKDLNKTKEDICYLGNESDACIEAAKISAKRDDDYDLMASAEGVDAKLNLARFYIAKGETKIAEEMLHEVLIIGNQKQKDEAKEMLQTI